MTSNSIKYIHIKNVELLKNNLDSIKHIEQIINKKGLYNIPCRILSGKMESSEEYIATMLDNRLWPNLMSQCQTIEEVISKIYIIGEFGNNGTCIPKIMCWQNIDMKKEVFLLDQKKNIHNVSLLNYIQKHNKNYLSVAEKILK